MTAGSGQPKRKVTLEVSREHGALQLSINSVDERGGGNGYRIAGPEFSGGSTPVLTVTLDAADAAQIRRYIDQITAEASS